MMSIRGRNILITLPKQQALRRPSILFHGPTSHYSYGIESPLFPPGGFHDGRRSSQHDPVELRNFLSRAARNAKFDVGDADAVRRGCTIFDAVGLRRAGKFFAVVRAVLRQDRLVHEDLAVGAVVAFFAAVEDISIWVIHANEFSSCQIVDAYFKLGNKSRIRGWTFDDLPQAFFERFERLISEPDRSWHHLGFVIIPHLLFGFQ
mmetsp:Transcript_9783/g.21790  ORF Transcript_9783/g.21790 Transcript_9783/m.21790 type:complete len:205 (+) Transcript_9783:498-1112(+)